MSQPRFLLIALAIFTFACSKDEHPDMPFSTCDQHPELFISYFTEERFQYKSPFYNPLNENEFCYFYRDNLERNFALMKYNIQTGEKVQLASNANILTKPVWSKKGWIAYSRIEDYQIWMIRADGDSLKMLTQQAYNFNLCWDAPGDHLLYRHAPNFVGLHYFIRHNISSLHTDTITQDGDPFVGFIVQHDISHSNLMAASTWNNGHRVFGLFDLNIIPPQFTEFANLHNAEWSNLYDVAITADGKKSYIAVLGRGIFEIDNATGKSKRLIEACWDKSYAKISLAPNEKSLITERVDSYLGLNDAGAVTGNIIQRSNIYTIDLNTMEEKQINLE